MGEDTEKQIFDDEGKTRINNMLFQIVPPGMTIREFENLAIEVFWLVEKVWDGHSATGEDGAP